MAKISSPMVFEYTPNPDLSAQDNMQSIIQDIVEKTGDAQYKITLTLPGIEVDAAEQREVLEQAIADATEMENAEMIPVSVDAEGNPLYQRKDTVVKE